MTVKYPLHKDFRKYAHLRMPKCTAILPFGNAVLRAAARIAYRGKGVNASVKELRTDDGAHIRAVLYEPSGVAGKTPCLVYFHGGGFAVEAAPCHYYMAKRYAVGAFCRVLFAEYRLAPKHKFPTPLNDCFCALKWVYDNADALNIDASRVALGGDSAGGALAIACAMLARDRKLPRPCLQMLVYPVTDRRMATESMKEFTDTPMWNAKLTRWMWDMYFKGAAADSIAYASPMEAESFANMPPAYIETAEFDCLRDEGEAYAAALKKAGVAVEQHRVGGGVHGYDMARNSGVVQECMKQRIEKLRAAFYE